MNRKLIRLAIMTSVCSLGIFATIVLSSSFLFARDSFGQSLDPQKVFLTIDIVHKPLGNVFKEIEGKTAFGFFYNTNNFDINQQVTLKANRKSVSWILSQISSITGLEFKQINNYFSVRPKAKEKTVIVPIIKTIDGINFFPIDVNRRMTALLRDTLVKGKVVNSKNEALVGVTVHLQGSNRGTVSDPEGNFSIQAPKDATLEFSYIGYETRSIRVDGSMALNIVLNSNTSGLDEVVVVGYGTQKKSVVTGAISGVKASDFQNQQIGRIEQIMQGRVSGVTIASNSGSPGAASTVRIRGTTSLNDGASDPLYVVDGIVVGTGGIDYLNPDDIASIEVLKDAASAAIYGARSAAGVILVTTKKGSSGLHINYNGYYGIQGPAKKLKLLNASQYASLINEQAVNDGGTDVYDNPAAFGKGTDWQDLIFNKHAHIQNHEVSISGGSDNATFYSSFGYFDQQGIVATSISEYKRYNIRLNASYKIAPWLTLGETLGYSHVNNKGGVNGNSDFGGPLSSAIMLDPITPAIITDPSEAAQVPYSSQPVEKDAQGRPYGISKYVAQQVTNPLAYIQTSLGDYSWSDDMVGNAFLEAKPIKGLTLRSTVGVNLSYWGSENFTPIFFLNSNTLTTQTSFGRDREKSLNWNLENTISYNRVFDKHNFTILLGQGAYVDNNSSGINVTYFNLPADNFKDASMNYSISADDITAKGYEGIQHRVSSLFGRLTYDYASKYLFTGIIRRDGSSRFGSTHKYGYFPSASAGWVASEENFWPAKNSITFFKLRGSYGITGNDVLGNFRYLSTVGGGRNYTIGDNIYTIGYSPDAPANPDLKWEQTSQLDFGFDAVLFQNWTLAFDWYNKKTTGILQVVSFPAYVGATGASYGNVADMENRGMELELGYQKQFGAFHLNMKGNVSYLHNEVTYLGDGKMFLDGGAKLQSSAYPLTRTAVGQPIGAFFGFETDGIFQNQNQINGYTNKDGQPIQPDAKPGDFKWKDINGDGQITDADRTFIGNPIPNWSYGVTLNASWNNFDFLVFGQGVAGNQIFQGLRRLDIPTANWQTTVLDRWHGENTSNSYPRLTVKDKNKNYSYPSDFHLSNGNYFRIKTVQIGYTLSKGLVNRIKMQSVRIYVSSSNLFTITKYTGYDPEIGGSSYGIDRAIYPQARSFLLGLNIGFK